MPQAIDSIAGLAERGLTPAGAARPGRAGASGGGAFAAMLSGRQAEADSPNAARQAAEELVSIALIQPVLAQMRESNMAEAPFAPGPAEKAFAPLLDAEIAHRMVQRADWGLVEAVARRLQASSTHSAAAAPPEVDVHA